MQAFNNVEKAHGSRKSRTEMGAAKTWEDHYTRRARKEKWLARSVYKLQEIDRKYRLLFPGARILDLGCHPGSWTQYCLQKTGGGGEVIGIDLQRPDGLSAPNFRFLEEDVLQLEPEALRESLGPMDVVLSDLAPRTTGVKSSDASRSAELASAASSIAASVLKPGGHFLGKIFESQDVKDLRQDLRRRFAEVKAIRPDAVRKGSRELYLLGLKLRGDRPSGRRSSESL
jgi:23S rRNA (uridine2552-2'-O)-methyltransferase